MKLKERMNSCRKCVLDLKDENVGVLCMYFENVSEVDLYRKFCNDERLKLCNHGGKRKRF